MHLLILHGRLNVETAHYYSRAPMDDGVTEWGVWKGLGHGCARAQSGHVLRT